MTSDRLLRARGVARRATIVLVCVAAAALAGDADVPDPAEAAKALAAFCEGHPDDLDARVRLGELNLAAHDVQAAERAFLAVLDKDPKNARALFGRGRAAQDRGWWPDAAKFYERSLDAAPDRDPAKAWPALVHALSRAGDETAADQALEKALALPADKQDPLLWNVASYRALDAKRPDVAVERARELMRRFPGSPWGPSALGWAFKRQGKDAEAYAAYAAIPKLRAAQPPAPQRTKLSLPFAGRWQVTQGPGGAFSHQSHRSLDAWDFRALDDEGRICVGRGTRNEDFPCFGRPILAAADGWVVDLRDGVPDNEPGAMDPVLTGGNYVFLEHAPGEVSEMLHLKKGSVCVKLGQRVARGDPIGRCGNSGYAVVPHLHFALCVDRPPGDATRPAVFARYVRTRAGKSFDVADGCPGVDQWVEPAK